MDTAKWESGDVDNAGAGATGASSAGADSRVKDAAATYLTAMKTRTDITGTGAPTTGDATNGSSNGSTARNGRATRQRASLRWLERAPSRHPARPAADLRDIREGQHTAAALRRDTRVRWSLAVADVAAAVVALGVAIAIGSQRPTLAVVAAPLLIVVFCKLGRLYDRDEHVVRKSTLEQAPGLLQVATTYSLITWLASSAFVDGGLDKTQVAAMWGVLLVGLVVLRDVARRIAVRTMPPERLLVLGGAEPAERLRARLETAHSLHAVLIGRVALDRGDRDSPAPLGPLEDLDYVLRHDAIERVIIAPTEKTSDEMLETIRLVKALGVKVSVLPRLFEVVGSSMEFDDIDGITMLGLRRYGLTKTSWHVKRAFDLVLTTVGLVVLAPLFAVVAVAVRLSSPGPILFRQPRVGRRGQQFEMFKFRTMYEGADRDKAKLAPHNQAAGLFKIVDDPRVTPIGHLLRRASLDEVPQLINVLRGEMSLVGPRPLVEDEDRKIAGWNHRRREGTPGMTGVWQVLGPTRVSLDDMVKLDYLYRANWSLWLDLKILLRTAGHIASGRGV
jgi:exopolysaccharide biosynthesis polyprenyl glycosylphosphotransferase